MTIAGVHELLDMYGCAADLLDDPARIARALREASDRAGATWLGEASHRFDPAGVTCVGLLAESHIALHTWPEIRFAAADIFTCGDTAVPRRACAALTEIFRPDRAWLVAVPRAAALDRAELEHVNPAAAHLTTGADPER